MDKTSKGESYSVPMYPTEVCWQTHNFTEDCECRVCEHKWECSGYEEDEE